MLKISVIGGGITGIAAAHLTANPHVTIFEASKNLGGILRDYELDGFPFFSACQYFSGGSTWFDKLGVKKHFYQFPTACASYTDIFETKTFSDTFAGPVFESSRPVTDVPKEFLGQSLAARCDLYPPKISASLKKWLTFIGVNLATTHHSAIMALQANRIYLRGQEYKMSALKKRPDSLADSIYGLPRSEIGLGVINSLLPRSGFNKVFDDLSTVSRKIQQARKGTAVNCEIQDQRIALKTKQDYLESDLVIWTADPTKLIHSAFGQKLDSQQFKAETLAGFLDSDVPCPLYIQVYSLNSRVLRIFLYNIEGRGCFTVEKAFDDQETGDIMSFCQSIVTHFSSRRLTEAVLRKKNVRYFLHTINDHKVLSRLSSQKAIKNLIVPSYVSYGRDQKIQSIQRQLPRGHTP